jgi:PAS domain-containing protein
MGGLNIRLRIWLSIGIFVFGYLLSTLASQLASLSNEHDLSAVADVLVPAVQRGRDATFAFDGPIKGYADSFLLRDPSGLERADAEGAEVLERLQDIAQIQGIAAGRAATAVALASAIGRFEDEAMVAYQQVPSQSDSIPQELQGKIQKLGTQRAALRGALWAFDHDLSQDLDVSRQQIRRRSGRMRVFTLGLFAATLIVATIVVNLTIERSITAPLAEVQSELAHERDLLRILLDNIPDYIYFKDTDNRFIRINKALASRFGLDDPKEALGRSDAEFFDAETLARLRADNQRIVMSGQPFCRGSAAAY